MLKGVRFKATASNGKQLAQQEHGAEGLTGPGRTGQDNGLWVAGFGLLAHGIADNACQLRRKGKAAR